MDITTSFTLSEAPAAFAAGVLSCLTTCLVPLAVAWLALITGTVLARRRKGESGPGSSLYLLGLLAGFSVLFVVRGLPATDLGFWSLHLSWVFRLAGGGLTCLYGLYLLGRRSGDREEGEDGCGPLGFWPALAMGLGWAAAWEPCAGITLNTIVLLAGSAGNLWPAALLLSGYALGQGLLLLLLGLAWHHAVDLAGGMTVRPVFLVRLAGVVLVLVGIFIIINRLDIISPPPAGVFGI
ncbi:MAG: cytochrome c biogenesis protein CcdA [Thermodesulfobacteriota bacterium]